MTLLNNSHTDEALIAETLRRYPFLSMAKPYKEVMIEYNGEPLKLFVDENELVKDLVFYSMEQEDKFLLECQEIIPGLKELAEQRDNLGS